VKKSLPNWGKINPLKSIGATSSNDPREKEKRNKWGIGLNETAGKTANSHSRKRETKTIHRGRTLEGQPKEKKDSSEGRPPGKGNQKENGVRGWNEGEKGGIVEPKYQEI